MTRQEERKKEIALYVFTPQGLDSASRLAGRLRGTVFAARSLRERALPASCCANTGELRFFSNLSSLMAETFAAYSCHIFISATGIAVRAIAPHIKSKLSDPAVLVIDQHARFVISLLSGHLGGANALAAQVARLLGATPVISTATDLEGLPALDCIAREQGLVMANPQAVKAISAALLAGKNIALHDPGNRLRLSGSAWSDRFLPLAPSLQEDPRNFRELEQALARQLQRREPAIMVTEFVLPQSGRENLLVLHPSSLAAGMGCKKGTHASALTGFLREVFDRHRLALASLRCIASLDAKKEEPGLREAARDLGVETRFFSASELACLPVSCLSAKAMEMFGVPGVAEPAALAAAGKGARLLIPKTRGAGITLAVARGFWQQDSFGA